MGLLDFSHDPSKCYKGKNKRLRQVLAKGVCENREKLLAGDENVMKWC
jgi:hypothetical protein